LKSKIIILILFFVGNKIYAQPKTNLEQIIGLINNSVVKIDSTFHAAKSVDLNVVTSPNLEVLKPKVFEKFSEIGYQLKTEAVSGVSKITYTILNCGIEYSDIRKDGLFGSTILDRNVSLKGSAIVTLSDGSIKPVEIKEKVSDVLNADDIKMIEDVSLPFTQAQIPQIPFFSNLLEPIVVVGTLVATVILLFTVRSK